MLFGDRSSALWRSKRGQPGVPQMQKGGRRTTGDTPAPTPDASCMDVPVKMRKGSRLFFVKSRLTTQYRTSSPGAMTRRLHKPLQHRELSRPACARSLKGEASHHKHDLVLKEEEARV